jgi:hypothetical protein
MILDINFGVPHSDRMNCVIFFSFFILEIIIGMETYIYSDNGNLEFFNYFFTLIHSNSL